MKVPRVPVMQGEENEDYQDDRDYQGHKNNNDDDDDDDDDDDENDDTVINDDDDNDDDTNNNDDDVTVQLNSVQFKHLHFSW